MYIYTNRNPNHFSTGLKCKLGLLTLKIVVTQVTIFVPSCIVVVVVNLARHGLSIHSHVPFLPAHDERLALGLIPKLGSGLSLVLLEPSDQRECELPVS